MERQSTRHLSKLSLQVILATKKPAKTQFGDGSISPQIKLAAKKSAKTQFGDGRGIAKTT